MSAGEVSVACTTLCQGFLKKRKDKIRLRWVTYWFQLHNTTLFFYNRKHGRISDLRGKYYLIEIESVRELMWSKKRHYIFEIAMKNGKRKVLAAETADIRQQWMCQLLQAINHQPNRQTASDYMCRTQSSPCILISDSHMPSIPSTNILPSAASHLYVDIDGSQNDISQHSVDKDVQKAEEIDSGNDYDVLPLYKPLHSDEGIYDTPPSNRRVSEKEYEAESIYDVPKLLFRKHSLNEGSCSKELPEITGLLHDMVTCLGGNSADWVKSAASGAICQPQKHCKDMHASIDSKLDSFL